MWRWLGIVYGDNFICRDAEFLCTDMALYVKINNFIYGHDFIYKDNLCGDDFMHRDA